MSFPARVVCILGMHRSGTSCLTGSLEQAGLFLAERHTWNPHNTKGNRENQNFVDLNDEVLAANGGAWDHPPARVVWTADQVARAAGLLARHAGEANFGFKDPRVLLVLDGWKRACPDMRFVGVFRHPNAVAKSLEKRSEMPREQALDLWYWYNRILYREQKKVGFPLLSFDVAEQEFKRHLAEVVAYLGLDPVVGENTFYDEHLRTSNQDIGEKVPWKLRRLYNKLLKRSLAQG